MLKLSKQFIRRILTYIQVPKVLMLHNLVVIIEKIIELVHMSTAHIVSFQKISQ